MVDQGSWPLKERHDEDDARTTPPGSVPSAGDPSLELFGHGWTPDREPSTPADGYTGRHRATDGKG